MPLQGSAGSIWALTRSGFAGMFRNVFFWLALGYSAVVVGIFTTIVFVMGLVAAGDPGEQESFIRTILTENFMHTLVRIQIIAVIVVVAIVGTRTVSRDRLLGGLEFILSKAVPPWGYIASRTLTPTLAALTLLFLPVLLMVVLTILLVEAVPGDLMPLLWGTVFAALVISIVVGVLGAAVGSLVSAPRKAIVIWLLVMFATMPLGAFARAIGADWHWLVGPVPLLYATAFTLMGTPFPGNHVIQGWALVVGIVIACFIIMWWRVREVVR